MIFIATVCAILTAMLQYLALPTVDRARARKVVIVSLVGGSVFVLTLAIRTAYQGPSLHAMVWTTQAVLLAGALRILWSVLVLARAGRHAAGRPTRRSRTFQVCAALSLSVTAVAVPHLARYAAFASCDSHAFPEAAGKELRNHPIKNFTLTADYAGPISIIITAQSAQSFGEHALLLRWGEWRYCSIRHVPMTGLVLETLKNDRDSPPLRVAVWPPADVRVVAAPLSGGVDINMDWVTWPEWLVV